MSVTCSSIRNSYELYTNTDQTKTVNYSFPEGYITYLRPNENNNVVIYYIKIRAKEYGKGVWSNFIKFLMANIKINKICICAMSNLMIEYSTGKNYIDDNYWINQGGDGVWERNIENKKKYTGYEINPERLLKIKNRIKKTYTTRCAQCKEYAHKLYNEICIDCIHKNKCTDKIKELPRKNTFTKCLYCGTCQYNEGMKMVLNNVFCIECLYLYCFRCREPLGITDQNEEYGIFICDGCDNDTLSEWVKTIK